MKRLFTIAAAAALLIGLGAPQIASAAEDASAAKDKTPSKEVRALIKKVETKLQQGKDKEADFAAELKEFDQLIADLKTKAPDAAAEAAFMKALLYVQVLDDAEKGGAMMKTIVKDYPTSKFADQAKQVVASVERQAAAKKLQDNLKPGAPFPDFAEKDVNGKSFSLANYKGKVVLVDFWATWCGPCRAELPNVLEAYKKYHSKGFEILGISLDKDKEKLLDFVKSNEMTWQHYFDGLGWENKLSQKFGITGIPATFLVGGDGKIIATNLRGDDLSQNLEKALAKK